MEDEAATAPQTNYPNYASDKETFRSFLSEFVYPRTIESDDEPPYKKSLQSIKNREEGSSTFTLYLSDLLQWDAIRGGDLAQNVVGNTKRYISLFSDAMDEELKEMEITRPGGIVLDSIDVLHEQRMAQQARDRERDINGNNENNNNNNNNLNRNGNLANDPAAVINGNNPGGPGAAVNAFPPVLMRRYELRILPVHVPRPQQSNNTNAANTDTAKVLEDDDDDGMQKNNRSSSKGLSLREIRSSSIGQLVTITGMIVRTSDVKPHCIVATYTCDKCGCEVYQEIKGREFMPLRQCPTSECDPNGTGGGDTLFLQTRGSKFIKFQEFKLQELPNQVPIGHIPRCMSVHVHGELTRSAMPGDVVTIDGIFLPLRQEGGFRSIRAGLVATTFLEASRVTTHKKSYDDKSSRVDPELIEKVIQVAHSVDPVGRLSRSIAPEIFGMEDVKRALLLQLVGGAERKQKDGMRIRGDINICLMGDPGVAKSQLLKYIASMAPRGV